MSSIIKFDDLSYNKVFGTYYFILGFLITVFIIQSYINISSFDLNQKIITIALVSSFFAIFFYGLGIFTIISKWILQILLKASWYIHKENTNIFGSLDFKLFLKFDVLESNFLSKELEKISIPIATFILLLITDISVFFYNNSIIVLYNKDEIINGIIFIEFILLIVILYKTIYKTDLISKIIHTSSFFALKIDPHTNENLKDKIDELEKQLYLFNWNSIYISLKKLNDSAGAKFCENIWSQDELGKFFIMRTHLGRIDSEDGYTPEEICKGTPENYLSTEIAKINSNLTNIGFYALDREGYRIMKEINNLMNNISNLKKTIDRIRTQVKIELNLTAELDEETMGIIGNNMRIRFRNNAIFNSLFGRIKSQLKKLICWKPFPTDDNSILERINQAIEDQFL